MVKVAVVKGIDVNLYLAGEENHVNHFLWYLSKKKESLSVHELVREIQKNEIYCQVKSKNKSGWLVAAKMFWKLKENRMTKKE